MASPGLTNIEQNYREIERRALERANAARDSGKPVIMVGTATCGRAAGALEILKTIKTQLQAKGAEAEVMEVGCMGHCYAEPIVVISKPGFPSIVYGYVTPIIAERLVQDFILGDDPSLEYTMGALEANELVPSIYDLPRYAFEKLVLLEKCGKINPEDIDQYVAKGGYSALAAALQKEPGEIVSEIKASGLRGRGGAGFDAGAKWEACRQAAGDIKYIICNADEGDPGAFMDRAILESDPHSVIEGMVIAAYAIGSSQGYIYVRAEYPLAVQRLHTALRQAGESGFLGANILGSNFRFDIRIFEGSGAFVCGEATALVASIEGKPGLPRTRPPHLATSGLFGKPTVLNNVKTLAYVPLIVKNGASWFSQMGTGGSKGTAVFALAGKVVNTGLTEVPMGTTLRQVIFDIGGGIPKGKRFKAVQIGGPSGGCLPEGALDLPIDFDSLAEAGGMMGSGGMVVLDEDDCMVEIARYFLEFTQKESCGKCTMCRLGTRQMLEILQDITRGQGRIEDLDTLHQLAEDVKLGSLCGLGKTAPNPVLTTLRYFLDEYEAHIKERRCPGKVCLNLMTFYILPNKCMRSCDACVGTCTVEAIFNNKKGIKVIDQAKCVKCGTCMDACPPQYNAVVKVSPLSELPVAQL